MQDVIQRSDFYRASSLLHPLIVGGIALFVVYLYVRLFSSRSLSQLSAFSIVANICLGSTLSRTITQPDLNLARGMISILTIIGFEYITDWLTVQHTIFERVFRKHPTLLLFRGQMLHEVIRSHRITETAIHSTLRGHGCHCPSQAEAIVLEMNGTLSVIRSLFDPIADSTPSLNSVPDYIKLRKEWEMARKSLGRDDDRNSSEQTLTQRQQQERNAALTRVVVDSPETRTSGI